MPSAEIAKLAALGLPVLCSDTCTVLDLIRDPTRDSVLVHERQAATDLLAIIESGGLIAMLAEQVTLELINMLRRLLTRHRMP